MMKALKLWAGLACLVQLSGCGWMPWNPERLATTQRVAERCTSIGNVIDKNYQVSGKLQLLVGGIGGGWSQTGVVLSPEAAERQIQMDRLCRAWAVGAISDDKWSEIYIQFALASMAPLVRSSDPEANKQVLEATAQLKVLAEKIARLREGSTFSAKEVTSKLNAAIAHSAKSQQTMEEIYKGAAEAAAEVNLPVKTGSEAKRPDEKGGPVVPPIVNVSNTPDLSTVARLLGDVDIKIAAVERRLEERGQPFRNWHNKGEVKVHFESGGSSLSLKAKQILDSLVQGPFSRELRVEVMGYADTTGNTQKNARLSVARAEEVRDYLVFERNVPASYIVTLGRQQGVNYFGPPAENRIAIVRVLEEEGDDHGAVTVQRANGVARSVE